jgi:hypothetical protein
LELLLLQLQMALLELARGHRVGLALEPGADGLHQVADFGRPVLAG